VRVVCVLRVALDGIDVVLDGAHVSEGEGILLDPLDGALDTAPPSLEDLGDPERSCW
jgi:hypothetical protein